MSTHKIGLRGLGRVFVLVGWDWGGGYAYVLIDMISDCPLVSRYYCLLFYTDNEQFLQ